MQKALVSSGIAFACFLAVMTALYVFVPHEGGEQEGSTGVTGQSKDVISDNELKLKGSGEMGKLAGDGGLKLGQIADVRDFIGGRDELGLREVLKGALDEAPKGHAEAAEPLELEVKIGMDLNPLWIIPFVLILLSLAILPLAFPHFWESNRNKGIVAALISAPVFLYFVLSVEGGGEALLKLSHEYYAFILLLTALFTISGGIFLDGDLKATPLTNSVFLLIGALLASFIGTTGAAMLLLRPLLRTNSERKNIVHTFVFFIFMVANIGGCLTPLGDPPLFLGYLKGVPFTWTFLLWKEWLTANAILLVLYYIWDTRAYAREPETAKKLDIRQQEPLRIRGLHNFFFLGLVILAIVTLNGKFLTDHGLSARLEWLREPVLVICSILSWLLDKRFESRRTSPEVKSPREKNGFTFNAIIEVGVLFAGIFVTMLPAICYLKAHGGEFGVNKPWQFFWMSGGLSSFLDNAPTYVTYFALGQGLAAAEGLCSSAGACVVGVPAAILAAISCGAVFMGANSYIGNAPNFMVRSICEEAGVKMPSFFGYMKYSIGILIPIFIALTFIFFV